MRTTIHAADPPRHAASVDVEDWYQLRKGGATPLSERFEAGLEKVLAALAARHVRATFFVLGRVADDAPQVVRRIADAGHEIQSHGYAHRLTTDLTPEAFREDVVRAKGRLEDVTGSEVTGYRAPLFTIDARNLWALDVLAQTGHRYDSSIFPMKTRRYGVAGYPLPPRVVETPGGRRIVEAPVACVDWLGRRWPVGGGGYVRLWPCGFLRRAWRRIEREGRPGILYFHNYEYDPGEILAHRREFPLRVRLHQGFGRRGVPGKIDRLLAEFRFGPLGEVLAPLLEGLA